MTNEELLEAIKLENKKLLNAIVAELDRRESPSARWKREQEERDIEAQYNHNQLRTF